MSTMILCRKPINQNIRNIFNYLDRQYPTAFDISEIEQDIATGMTSLNKELSNAYKALVILKNHNKNNQKVCTTINLYLKMLIKESMVKVTNC